MVSKFNKSLEEPRGKYIFRKTKFAETNSIEEQIAHVLEEVAEVIKAKSIEEKFSEITDLRHSVETLVRIAEKAGMDVEAETVLVEEKNEVRGYYQLPMHCFGTHEYLNQTCLECNDLDCKAYTRRNM